MMWVPAIGGVRMQSTEYEGTRGVFQRLSDVRLLYIVIVL